MPPLRIAMVSAEISPWVSTGGLGEVVGALPRALAAEARVAVFAPLYRQVDRRGLEPAGPELSLQLGQFALPARIWTSPPPREISRGQISSGAPRAGLPASAGQPSICFVDCPALFDRPGGIYEHRDNAARFAYLCRAALAAAPDVLDGPPDVVHGHDWPAAALPALTALPTVLTVHNLAHQGSFPSSEWHMFGPGWPPGHFDVGHGWFNLLKGGISHASAVTTVSPNYAREILQPDMGCGLDGHLRWLGRRVHGIVNGIDTEVWNPADDTHIAAPYSASDLRGKTRCRTALLRELGLPATQDLVVGIVSRLAWQKGLDLVADVAPWLPKLGVRLVLLGTGDAALEARFRDLARRLPEHVGVRIGFDAALSHRIVAGADAVLMPSRFEPCGLSQLYAQRYGTVPIVHPVGGLDDTVHDPGDEGLLAGEGTGVRFFPLGAEPLAASLWRTARLRREHPRAWIRLKRRIMGLDLSWGPSARRYLDLYRGLVG